MVDFSKKKWEHILIFLIAGTLLILLNILGSRHFYRWDLTEEKRFSISDATKEMLGQLNEQVYVEVYLEGDLPSGFDRMKRSIQEVLDEFNVYSAKPVNYRFVNPDQAQGTVARDEFFQSLINRGIQPIDVFHTRNGNRIQKRIFPGALISLGIGEAGVSLFKGNETARPDDRLNQAIEGINQLKIAGLIHC